MEIKKLHQNSEVSVPETGFEPAHPFGRYHLKVVRLPISPPGRVVPGLMFEVNNFKPQTSNLKQLRIANVRVYFFNTILKVVPFPGSECFTKISPL